MPRSFKLPHVVQWDIPPDVKAIMEKETLRILAMTPEERQRTYTAEAKFYGLDPKRLSILGGTGPSQAHRYPGGAKALEARKQRLEAHAKAQKAAHAHFASVRKQKLEEVKAINSERLKKRKELLSAHPKTEKKATNKGGK